MNRRATSLEARDVTGANSGCINTHKKFSLFFFASFGGRIKKKVGSFEMKL